MNNNCLLTEKDIENINTRKNIYSSLNENVKLYKKQFLNYEFKHKNISKEELDKSKDKEVYLRETFFKYEYAPIILTCSLIIVLFELYISFSVFNRQIQVSGEVKYIIIGIFIFAISLALLSIRGLIVRHKIKKNFKEFNLNI